MSSIRAFDKAQDAYNLAKKVAVQTKVIVFSIPRPRIGVYPLEIRFPYGGKILSIYASCAVVGSEKTVMRIEKCSQDDYDSSSTWVSILSSDLIIDAGEKSTSTSLPYSISEYLVNEGDHFRINFVEVGPGLGSLVLEIVIEI